MQKRDFKDYWDIRFIFPNQYGKYQLATFYRSAIRYGRYEYRPERTLLLEMSRL